MIEWLEQRWYSLAKHYLDIDLQDNYWRNIHNQYSARSRHYHNLKHLYHMFQELDSFKDAIEDIHAMEFAIWYHDIIYKSTKSDNEEKSAELAKKELKMSNFDENRIKKIEKLIISTKKHELILKENEDNAYLLDLDLSILGSDWTNYQSYIKNIRKEYKIYPKLIYNPGRKKVLSNFIEREHLFFTTRFRDRFESIARENIQREIDRL